MSRFRAASAAFLAAASVVAAAAPAATAQEGGIQEGIERPAILDQTLSSDFRPCGSTITVPNCVNYAFDTASAVVTTAEELYRRTAERYACDVHWILTGEYCPDATDVL